MNQTLRQNSQDTQDSQRRANLSRRRFLRGVGMALALPAFESLMPANAMAATKLPSLATTATGMPVRLAFMYIPNGVNMKLWYPEGSGKDFTLGKTMEPIAAFKDKLQVIANLDQVNAELDGAGDHARGGGVWLTGVRINKSNDKIGTNVSIDHVAAQQIGKLTRFPSLELTAEKQVRQIGGCDSGYSCQYEYNISWRSTTTPNAPEANPRLVFERLFGNKATAQMRQEQHKSVLDFVSEDAKSVSGALGAADKQKMEEYLNSIRELELRVDKGDHMKMPEAPAGARAPTNIPATFEERIATQFEMLRLAFQTDSTRVSTLLLARDGDDQVHNFLPGITRGHHTISHHMKQATNLAMIAQIEYWYMQQFAKFLKKMEDTKDADGSSLLDNSMLMYGAGNADPDRHSHRNLPTLLVGGGGGALNPGRYVNAAPAVKPMTDFSGRGGTLPRGIPMCNMFLGLLDKLGVKGVDRFGDSNGKFMDL